MLLLAKIPTAGTPKDFYKNIVKIKCLKRKKQNHMPDNSDKKIKDIFNSLDGIKRASPAPYFFTRLEARMQKEKSIWEEISSFVARPLVALACICLVIMVNTSVIISSEKSNQNTSGQNNDLATVDEYNQVSSTFYEFVNTKP